jgi:hypothetical protein
MSRQRLEEWPCESNLWLSVWIDKHGPLKLEDMWNLTDDIVNVTTHFNIMHLPCNCNTHTFVLQFTTECYVLYSFLHFLCHPQGVLGLFDVHSVFGN